MRLVRFELAKIWRKKQLIALLLAILLVNTGLQWYGNRATGNKPGLSSYKKAAELLAPMTEGEKAAWLQSRAEDLESLRVTEQIAAWSGRDGNSLEELSGEHQEIFQKWYPVYEKGDFLLFTESLDQEITLTNELCQEAEPVTHYGEYLQEMQKNQKELSGISIFASSGAEDPEEGEKTGFSQRNIGKSRQDYQSRTGENVRWAPSKGPVSAIDNPVTGILFFVGIFLFAVWGIMEEKEKKLFFITRVTEQGILPDILARMAALGISCVLFGILIYGSNWLFYCITTGFWDLSRDIQSVSEYMQSCYTMTLGQFMVCSVMTKAIVAFCFGLLLQFVTILGCRKILPFVAGIVILVGNILLYELLPAVGGMSILKYMNLMGVFHTENLYGDYLNFDIGGIPVARTGLSLLLILLLLATGCVLVAVAFCKGNNFLLVGKFSGAESLRPIKMEKPPGAEPAPFRRIFSNRGLHTSLFRHEWHKAFITNHALLVLLGCLLLTGWYHASQNHKLSVQEQYYKELMMELEGDLTEKKEEILFSEKQRYDNASQQIEQINEMAAEGKLSEVQADEQRDRWNAVMIFYPAFQRAWQQYERIQESGGNFIYDTGYLYLFGVRGEGYQVELLVFVIGILLMFSNSAAMEYQNKTDLLIRSSMHGMKKVIQKKAWICILAGGFLPVCTRIFHGIWLQKTFPIHQWGSSIHSITRYQDLPADVPIWVFAIAVMGIQILICSLLALCVMFLSYWRRNFIQTVLAGAVIFVVPLALYVQGIDFMGYLTVYPVYTMLG